MLDDLRHHDPTPTAEEKAWMDCDLSAIGALAATAIVLAGILTVSEVLPDEAQAAPRIVAAAPLR